MVSYVNFKSNIGLFWNFKSNIGLFIFVVFIYNPPLFVPPQIPEPMRI